MRLGAGGRCPIGMPVLFRNEYAIERLSRGEQDAWLTRLFAWIAIASEDSPVSLGNFERVMRGTRTLARYLGRGTASVSHTSPSAEAIPTSLYEKGDPK